MGQTPNLSLPYPELADTADVPRDIKALADKLDTYRSISGIPVVTTLPASPVDGQEIYYVADAAAGVIWHLHYRSASASTYKWEFVGGSELWAGNDGLQQNISTAVYANIQPPVLLNLALAGDYMITHGAYLWNTAGEMFLSAWMSPGPAVDADAAVSGGPSTSVAASRSKRRTLAAAAGQVVLQVRSSGGTGGQVGRPFVSVRPIRVG